MKKVIILSILLLAFEVSNAQDTPPEFKVILGIGEHETFISNPEFNSWTMINYGRIVRSSANISGQLSFAFNKFDSGVYLTANYPFQNMEAYFGPRLTRQNSKLSSFLNLEFGQLNAHYKNITPINYTPTPDQQGQDLELRYFSYYLGISSLNYFGHPIMRGRQFSLYPGFHIAARYGFPGGWSYGYYDYDKADNLEFNSVDIHNIPKLSRFNVDIGFFVGFGTR